MEDATTQSDLWCPNGSEQISPNPAACTISIDLAAAAALALIFPVGIPAEIASLIAGVSWGTIAAAALCSMPPVDPGPFPVDALLTTFLGGEAALLSWIALSLERYWWKQCCACKAPPPDAGSVIGSWNALNQTSHYVYAQVKNPAYGYNSVIWIQGSITNVEAAGTGYWLAVAGGQALGTSGACPTDVAFNNGQNQLAWGPGASGAGVTVFGGYGSTLVATSRFSINPTTLCVGIRYVPQGTTAAHANVKLQLLQAITDPQTYPTTATPPNTQPVAPSGGGSNSPIYGAPSEGIVPCNFAPIAANWIERSLAPRSRVADGGVVHISGANVVAIPAGAIGWTVRITAYPPGHSHDAGDPPQLYQVGWMAPSIDGVELSSRPQPITAGQEQFWMLRPTDAYVSYNLYPGFTADIQFWSTATPN